MKILQTLLVLLALTSLNCGSKERLIPMFTSDWFTGKPQLIFYDTELEIFCTDRDDFLVPSQESKCLPLQTKKVLIEGSCKLEQDFVVELPYNLIRAGLQNQIKYVEHEYVIYPVTEIIDLGNSPTFEIKNDECTEIKQKVPTLKFVLITSEIPINTKIFAYMPYIK